MVYKPLDEKTYLQYLRIVGWTLKKGGKDWSLYDEKDVYVCTIKIAHGSRTKNEVIAHSVKKTENEFKDRGLKWPPSKK